MMRARFMPLGIYAVRKIACQSHAAERRRDRDAWVWRRNGRGYGVGGQAPVTSQLSRFARRRPMMILRGAARRVFRASSACTNGRRPFFCTVSAAHSQHNYIANNNEHGGGGALPNAIARRCCCRCSCTHKNAAADDLCPPRLSAAICILFDARCACLASAERR